MLIGLESALGLTCHWLRDHRPTHEEGGRGKEAPEEILEGEKKGRRKGKK